jgi:hypothetical protein
MIDESPLFIGAIGKAIHSQNFRKNSLRSVPIMERVKDIFGLKGIRVYLKMKESTTFSDYPVFFQEFLKRH